MSLYHPASVINNLFSYHCYRLESLGLSQRHLTSSWNTTDQLNILPKERVSRPTKRLVANFLAVNCLFVKELKHFVIKKLLFVFDILFKVFSLEHLKQILEINRFSSSIGEGLIVEYL